MDRGEFIKKLTSKSELNEEQAGVFVDSLVKTLGEYFKKGEKVVIAEFGSFYVKDDKSVQFNPSSKLKDLIK